MKTRKIARQIESIRTTESTNETIYNMFQNKEVKIGSALVAEEQTNGKGRRGNKWYSSPSKSLTFSLIIKDNIESLIKKLPLISGFAIIEAIKQLTKLDCQLKWPNDIVYKNKKLGGVLIEKKRDNFIVGIGLNVNDSDFDKSIEKEVCSIYSIINYPIQREPLLAFIFNNFEELLSKNMEEIIKKWEYLCNHMNSFVKFHYSKQIVEGKFVGLNGNGEAKININEIEKVFHSGVIVQ